MNYANRIGWTDVNPCEIVKTISEKTLEIREMDAERDPTWKPDWHPGGFSGHCSNQYSQRWDIASNENNPVIRIRLSKNKGWQDKHGQRYKLSDEPRKFYDYNF
jgi:hypothetical protein